MRSPSGCRSATAASVSAAIGGADAAPSITDAAAVHGWVPQSYYACRNPSWMLQCTADAGAVEFTDAAMHSRSGCRSAPMDCSSATRRDKCESKEKPIRTQGRAAMAPKRHARNEDSRRMACRSVLGELEEQGRMASAEAETCQVKRRLTHRKRREIYNKMSECCEMAEAELATRSGQRKSGQTAARNFFSVLL